MGMVTTAPGWTAFGASLLGPRLGTTGGEEESVSHPKRFAGYQSPGAVLRDAALSTDQKLSALLGWRRAAEGYDNKGETRGQTQLIAEIERALAAVGRR